jgi:hypothetical protein
LHSPVNQAAVLRRGGDDLATALAQDRNALRADQSSAADRHGLLSHLDDRRPLDEFEYK